MPALQRRALLETLLEIGDEEAPNFAFKGLIDALNRDAADEYVVGCISALRSTRSVDVSREDIGQVLRKWLLKLLPLNKARNRAERAVLRECLLALGVYGSVQDIETLIDMLKDDFDYEFGDQITHSLERLLRRDPEDVGEDVASRLRDLGRELLSSWMPPRVLRNMAIFAQASQVISVLCARLEPRELDVAFSAVRSASDVSLALRMRQHVKRCREALLARGHESWLSRVGVQAEEIEVQLQDLTTSSPDSR
jgi:HEAT repeat protein